MQQKSKNRIRVVLFLFLFGFMSFALGLGYMIRGSDPLNIANLLATVLGALVIILAAYLVKKQWY